MPRKLVVEFTKMQGAGNDFLVLNNRFFHFSREELSAIARRYCTRRFGIGADGLLALGSSDAADFSMIYVNADGSAATMCGNGARCLALYAVRAGVGGPEVTFTTDAGRYHAQVLAPSSESHTSSRFPGAPDAVERVRLFVPDPERWTPNIGLDRPLPDGLDTVHYIWTGTHHVVGFVDAVERAPIETWGPHIRHDPAMEPEGTNLNLVQVLPMEDGSSPSIRVRTFEKGVEAETLACGTGVLASAVTTARHLQQIEAGATVSMPVTSDERLAGDGDGLAEAGPILVETRGGPMTVGRVPSGNRSDHLYLEGPVASVFRGTFEWDPRET